MIFAGSRRSSVSMKKIEINTAAYTTNFIYLLKCICGVIICYILYTSFPAYPFYWALVSVVVSMAPDSSNKLAYDRMKANMIGCAAGICLYPLQLPSLVILCLGVTLTIIIGIALQMTNTLKTALAALVIINIEEQHEKHWYIALERVSCVVVGCLVALAVTLLFNRLQPEKTDRLVEVITEPEQVQPVNDQTPIDKPASGESVINKTTETNSAKDKTVNYQPED